MNEIIFLLSLSVVLLQFLAWGFKYLPRERWQMLAVVPVNSKDENEWNGANLTYYGFFLASSQMISVILLMILLGSVEISLVGTGLAVGVILLVCIPAARIMAMIVEKKRHTFTIGGASFVGILLAPWVVLFVQKVVALNGISFPVIPVLAAMSIAYTLGEGLGRLGCISYGCCYGKPVAECNGALSWLFSKVNLVFHGSTKKVAYESQLTGVKLVPIQAITCVMYTLGSLIGSFLFFKGFYSTALMFTIALTQIWRVISETLRADFRGFGKVSAYQKMGLFGVLYMFVAVYFLPSANVVNSNVIQGLQVLWSPWVIIGLQLLWVIFFAFFGRSTVTTSNVKFELIEDRL